jgi:ketosteroid isomerase-like protein
MSSTSGFPPVIEVQVKRTDPREVVEELAQRFARGDREGAMSLFDPEVRIEQPPTLPHGGWHTGPAGMADMGAEFARHWDRTIKDPRIFGGDPVVVQVTTQTWTARSTGRSATVDVVELFQVANGLICEIRVFQQDTHLLISLLEAG